MTISRLDAVHRWPAWKYAPFTATATAVGRCASSSTMSGFLPPISSCTRTPDRTAASATERPTSCEPVKLTASMSGEETSAAPMREPGPITRFRTPGGRPARCTMSTIIHGEAGTSSAGLKTTQLPKASAGAIFQAGMASGKFHGVTAATTPTGSRVTSISMPGRTESSRSPDWRSASPAKYLKMAPARPASPMPSAIGLPCSRASSRPSSSLRARISVPARSRMSNRCCGVVCDQPSNAVRAAAMARSTSAAVARAYSPIVSAVFDGLMSGARSAESTRWPSIRLLNAVLMSRSPGKSP